MQEANPNTTTKRRGEPLGNDFWSAVDQRKRIADQSGDAAPTESPVNTDRLLLDLCAEALHHLRYAQKAWDARRENRWAGTDGPKQVAAMAADQRLPRL